MIEWRIVMRYLKNVKVLVLLCTFILLLAGCANSGDTNKAKDNGNKKMKVVTTFYPMYEFTKKVAGDKADVQLLIPANVEPHDWEPTPKDVANIQNAKLLVYNSDSLETWVPNIKNSLGNNGPTFVAASNGISLMKGVGDEESKGVTKWTRMYG